jgi:hypothetical protein
MLRTPCVHASLVLCRSHQLAPRGYGGAPSAVINPDSLASVTMKFNLYCDRRALAPEGVTIRPSKAYIPCFDEFVAQDAFPELDFDAICQVCLASVRVYRWE